MTKVLITGLTGMVGSHLADYLLAHTDWQIYGLIRWRSPLENIAHLLPLANAKNRVHLLYGDLRDSDSINNAVRECQPDYVFHLAAQSYPKTSFTSPLDTYETNVCGTSRVLEALRQHSPEAIIHVCSSSEIFGRVSKENLPINEEAPLKPSSPYAISKVGTDLIGRYYAEAYGMNVQTTRMGTHTGPRRGDVFHESSFAKQIAMIEAGQIEPVIKVGNLESMRTYADVRDAVRAYHMLLTVNPVAGAYYNIAGNYVCKVGGCLNYLLSLSTTRNIRIEVDQERLRLIDADNQEFCTEKFRNHTKWSPEISFEQTMLDLLNYWREKVKSQQFLTR